MIEWMNGILTEHGLRGTVAASVSVVMLAVCVTLVGLLICFVVNRLTAKAMKTIVRKSGSKWCAALYRHSVLERLTWIIPALVLHGFAPEFLGGEDWARRIAFCLTVIAFLLSLDKFLDAVNDVYRGYEVSKLRPIKGYLQVLKIVTDIVGGVVIISVLLDRSPMLLLGGIGAATAVLLLIFQNTILGFVASIQLTENDMVRLGDWIEMPKHDANGTVTEISLHTVKVRNGDNTITTVPTYALVSESFKNWRPMHESGGRRIERALYIDMTSIRFCSGEMLRQYEKMPLIQGYLKSKMRSNADDPQSGAGGRSLTNVAVFQAYLSAYLKHHPGIHKKMTCMVRQLASAEHGLPIQIYAFTNTTEWGEYEAIQSDIFSHIFAVLPEFDLRIFQEPGGYGVSVQPSFAQKQEETLP